MLTMPETPRTKRYGRLAQRTAIAAALMLGSLLVGSELRAQAPLANLTLEGMRFVLSQGDRAELVLFAESAEFDPSRDEARLHDVSLALHEDDGAPLTLKSDDALLHLSTRDFEAEGPVHGRTGDGRRFEAREVRYRHGPGVFESERPIRIEDGAGLIEARGFRYLLRDRRFVLTGHARVVATP